jgi:hypothetical protein
LAQGRRQDIKNLTRRYRRCLRDRRTPFVTEDSLPAAGREGTGVEIEEQANVQIRTSQVRQDLRAMHRGERVP